MAVSQSYRDFVLEQLGRVTPVTGKSMFGDVGIYASGTVLRPNRGGPAVLRREPMKAQTARGCGGCCSGPKLAWAQTHAVTTS
jgi:TfoX/Sxy family transcriptional regulator of competence genes